VDRDGRARLVCESGRYCWYSEAGFSGAANSYDGDLNFGGCYLPSSPGFVRSYSHNHRQEGYFFENDNCTGRAHAVVAYRESSDIGFYARSFRADCVSCLAKKD
jgi:hypothetical protein